MPGQYPDTGPTGVCFCGILVIALVIEFVIVYFLYTRAEEYGQSGCLWALFGFFFPVPAVVIFLLVNMGSGRTPRERRSERYINPGIYGGQPGEPAQPQMPRHGTPDPFFRDDHLDALIEEGHLSEARKYLREMIDMARSMHDEAGLRNYAQYEPKINKAAMDGTRHRGGYS